ncbi:MAG TPA: NAD kinase [Flavobacteriales bacterium]|nr:NAD kinase [Flavobacteriales bacterium]
MKLAIYGRSFNESFNPVVQALFDRLALQTAEVFIFDAFYSFLKPRINFSFDVKTYVNLSDMKYWPEYVVSIGGDGSMLDSVALVKNTGIPILGINTGRLGFLSNISTDDVQVAIDALVSKNYKIETRSLLELSTSTNVLGENNFALNELTIHKKDSSTMMTVHAYINNEYLNSYWADGLIVATPTGSTAYSLSCGGPIVLPDSKNFIITPIAPHNLNVRPVVIPDSAVITLKADGRSSQFLVSLDSRSEAFDSETEFTIRKAGFSVNLIQLHSQNFLTTMRHKLTWGADKRN